MTRDFAALAQELLNSSGSLVREWLPGGVYKGTEWVALNPRRQDNKRGSFSVNLETGKWSDFALDDANGGDLISLYAYLNYDMDMGKAYDACAEKIGFRTNSASRSPPPKEDTPPDTPPKIDGPIPATHPQLGKPSAIYEYRKEGKIWARVFRFDPPSGKKSFAQVAGDPVWRKVGGVWTATWWGRPKGLAPLFNLDQIEKEPDATILLVEGEKAVLAGQRILESLHSVVLATWIGGSNALKRTDFSPFKGRKIVILPDNDEAGKRAAVEAAHACRGAGAASVWIIEADANKKEKWDLADWKGTPAKAVEWIVARLAQRKRPSEFEKSLVQKENRRPKPDPALPPRTREDAMPPRYDTKEDPPQKEDYIVSFPDDGAEETEDWKKERGYDVQGVDWADGGPKYLILSKETGRIHALTPGQLKKEHLLAVMSTQEWRQVSQGEGEEKRGIPWSAIADSIMREGNAVGPVDMTERIHGRGAVILKSGKKRRLLIHVGDRILEGDNEYPPVALSRDGHVFERRAPLRIQKVPQLTDKEGQDLIALAQLPSWKNPELSGTLLIGWSVLAPFCGALSWRPHIMLTGPSGTGKTSLLSNLVQPLTAPWAFKLESSSTEAGVRHSLKTEPLPVIFDEAQHEGQTNQARALREILQLARSAASERGGTITQRGQSFKVRSMFCFAMTYAVLTEAADKNRFVPLALTTPDSARKERWGQFEKQILDLPLDINYRVFWRFVRMFHSFQKSRQTIREMLLGILANARLADVLSSLLAAAYTMIDDKPLVWGPGGSDWIDCFDWDDTRAEMGEQDADSVLAVLMGLAAQPWGKLESKQIGEIIDSLMPSRLSDLTQEEERGLQTMLQRAGFRIVKDRLFISNSSEFLTTRLAGGAYEHYSRILQGFPDSRRESPTSFGGSNSRSISIPLKVVTLMRPKEEERYRAPEMEGLTDGGHEL